MKKRYLYIHRYNVNKHKLFKKTKITVFFILIVTSEKKII